MPQLVRVGSLMGSGRGSSVVNGISGITPANVAALKAALLATVAGTSNTGFAPLGDSLTAGATGVSPSRFNGWVAQLAPLLATRFGVTVNLANDIGSTGHLTGEEAVHVAYDPMVTFNSITIQDADVGIAGFAFQSLLAANTPFRITPATQFPGRTFNRFLCFHRESAVTTCRWLDSTGATGLLQVGSNLPHVQILTCGAGATWIQFKSEIDGTIRFWGGHAYTAAVKEISMLNCGYVASRIGDGSNAKDWIRNDQPYRALGFIAQMAPFAHWFNIDLGTNDQPVTNINTYATGLGTLIDACKATGATVTISTANYRDPAGSGVAQVTQDAFIARAMAVAQSKAIPIIRTHDVLGLWSVANANGDMFDHTHPNIQGCAKKAARFDEFVRQAMLH